MSYTCHSGGCPGSDMTWENEGNKYGVKTIAYSFYRHVQESKNQKILKAEELNEGFEAVKIANKTLKRNPERQYQYVQNLLDLGYGYDDRDGVMLTRAMADQFNMGVIKNDTYVRTDVHTVAAFQKEEYGN